MLDNSHRATYLDDMNLAKELEQLFGTSDTTQWPELMTNEEFLKLFHIVPTTSYRLRNPIYRILDCHKPILRQELPKEVYDRLLEILLYNATYDEQRFRKKLITCGIEQTWHDTIVNIVYQPLQIRSVVIRRKVLVYKEDVEKLFPHQSKYVFGKYKEG